jgi:hypothetical protein
MVFPLFRQSARVTKNSKSQISNIKPITMIKIVSASLGLPTLRVGPQFQNSKPVLVIEYWNLRFVCNLVLGVWDFINSSTPKHLAIFSGNSATGGTDLALRTRFAVLSKQRLGMAFAG